MDITSRSVLMVGGTSGIGLELARRFCAAGSSVVAGGRSTDLFAQLARSNCRSRS
jgi:short-subunit dehydrogenase involved in D-alanine esterification of teichoic acids